MDRVATFIEHLRIAVPNAETVFKTGSCFQLFLMIRAFRPDAICWYDGIVGHVYTEVDGMFYDIDGPRKTLPEHSYILTKEPRIFKGAFRWRHTPLSNVHACDTLEPTSSTHGESYV